jgi:hypothetical protein
MLECYPSRAARGMRGGPRSRLALGQDVQWAGDAEEEERDRARHPRLSGCWPQSFKADFQRNAGPYLKLRTAKAL